MSNSFPEWTRGTTVRASASLGAGANDNANVDWDSVVAARLTVNNTPGGTVAATRGLQVDIKNRYGSSPTTSATAMLTYTLPSAVASTLESLTLDLPPGQYNILFTNLDASNAITVAAFVDTRVIKTQ